jgi:hypothetical protein
VQSIDPVASNLPARSRLLHVRALPLAILVALAACQALGPLAPLPDNAVSFVPPAEYQAWWALTEACSGRQGHPEGIRWYVVPDVAGFMTSQGEKAARWSRGTDGSRIVIAGAYMGAQLVVRHEMLHALLDRGDHPPEYFVERCHLTWESWAG